MTPLNDPLWAVTLTGDGATDTYRVRTHTKENAIVTASDRFQWDHGVWPDAVDAVQRVRRR